MTNHTEFPEAVESAFNKLYYMGLDLSTLSYQRGTDGKRGLYHKIKSLRTQIYKGKQEFEAKFPEYAYLMKRI